MLLLDVLRGAQSRAGAQGWAVEPSPTWCTVTASAGVARPHGWKLHVSATPLSAPHVLARAASVLFRHGVTFKFATDIANVIALVGPHQDRGSSGKFITAYPEDDAQARDLASELDTVTADLVGPRILSDRPVRPGSLVHYRYGQFAGHTVFTDHGVFESRMVGPDGSSFADERTAWFAPPPWAVPLFPISAVADSTMVLGGRFRVTEALRHANKGGVYRAIDERDGTRVIVKQARAHVGSRLDGTDVRDVLRHEARILRELSPRSVFPAFVALFEEQGDLFLAEEEIEAGRMDDVSSVATYLVRAIRTVHEAGMVLCDLKPANVIVTPGGGVRLIDAEVVASPGDLGVRGYTIGFAAPELLNGVFRSRRPIASAWA